MLPFPLPPPPPVIDIQVTLLVALHRHPAPVLTPKRPSFAFPSKDAPFPERVKFDEDPLCVTVLVIGVASPLPFSTIVPLREVTQPFGATANGTVALVIPPALSAGMLTHEPTLFETAQAQFAVTDTAPLPPAIEKLCDDGEKLKLHTAGSCVMFTNGNTVPCTCTVIVPVRLAPIGFASTENVNDPDPVI